ncbi:MAG: hypothetical protein WD207_08030 [Xanthobacteraceae bacterium]
MPAQPGGSVERLNPEAGETSLRRVHLQIGSDKFRSMTKLFRQTVEQVEKLPASEQDAAAGALMDYLDHMRGLALTDEQAAEVRRRLADPGRGVSLEDMRERFRSCAGN